MYIFISHSSAEADVASALCGMIEQNGMTCFLAPRDIRSGYEYAEEIANGIDRADAVLLLLSEAANRSPHVLREVERAVTKSVPILVYRLEKVTLTKSMEYFLMTHQWMAAGQDSYGDVVRCIAKLHRDEDGDKGVVTVGKGRAEKAVFEGQSVTKIGKGSRKRGLLWALATAFFVALAALWVVFYVRQPMKVVPGDTLVMGSYNGEEMEWRVLRVSEDGRQALVVSGEVLSVKAFDAPESGRYNHDGTENFFFSGEEPDLAMQAYIRGNSSWEQSNIRTWLNSDRENVVYEGQAPTSAAMADGTNGYHDEKGFLCNFTEKERKKIVPTTIVTNGNALSETEVTETRDYVFLLSLEELELFREADVALTAPLSVGAAEKNGSSWYQDYCLDYGTDAMMWWLREPVEDSSCQCYLVGNGYYEENIYTWEVGVESFGIRPAMTIDLRK